MNVREAMAKENEVMLKSKETIAQTNKKLQEIEEQATLNLEKEIMNITTKRKDARDER